MKSTIPFLREEVIEGWDRVISPVFPNLLKPVICPVSREGPKASK